MRAAVAAPVAAAVALAAACANPADYVVVTVAARDAVQRATSLSVTLGNAGSSRTDELTLGDQAFPVTFSISAPGRAGEVMIAIDALAGEDLVGRGAASAALTDDAASVMLESTDFVVNTDYAGDQYPSSDFEASGFQLAALPDGTWTAVFRDGCPSDACSLFGRRFDARGRPVSTAAAAGTNAFVINNKPTTLASTPAIASSQDATVAVWDHFDPGTAGTSGVACRSIDGAGGLGDSQRPLTSDPMESADVVSVVALAGGNFAATWKATLTGNLDAIRAVTFMPDCTPLGAVQTVAQGATATDILHRGALAATADHVLFAWIANGDLYTRLASAAGVLSAPAAVLIAQTAAEEIEHARVVALPSGGFALAVRWTQKATTTGTNRIEIYRLAETGAIAGAPVVVTDRSGNDFDSSESFGLASRAGDQVMVAWHTCGALGDDSMCGAFGRLLRRDPASDAFVPLADSTGALDRFPLSTLTLGDQRLPSVAGLPGGFVAIWSDARATRPDTAGQSVRARIVYPAP